MDDKQSKSENKNGINKLLLILVIILSITTCISTFYVVNYYIRSEELAAQNDTVTEG